MIPASVFHPGQDAGKQEERFFRNESYYTHPNIWTSLWMRLGNYQKIFKTSIMWKSSSAIPFKVFKKDSLVKKNKDRDFNEFYTRNFSSFTALG